MAGKPAAKIDVDQLEKLAQLHCTVEEAAAFFKCAKRTLLRYLDSKNRDPKYRDAWERGQSMGRLSLRRLQWRHAQGGGSAAVQMTIHLSKHRLGETEKSLLEIANKDGEPFRTEAVSARETIASRIAGMSERIATPRGSQRTH